MPSDTVRVIIETKQRGTGHEEASRGLSGVAKAAKIAAGAFAALKSAQVAVDFIKFGAGVQRQRQALDNLAKSAGTSGTAITRAIQEASGHTIDRMTAMSAATRALIMDVADTPVEFERMTEVAVALGRAMGVDAAKSIDDFVTAAARQSKLIADNLGLVIDVEAANRHYAAQLGKTAEALTDAEKKQGFLNAMLEAGEEKMLALGDTSLDTAGELEKLKASITNLKVAMAEEAAEAAKTPLAWANVQLQGAELRNELVRMQDELVALNMIAQEEVDAFDQLETKMKLSQASSEELTAARAEELDKLRAVRSEYEASAGMMDSWQRAMLGAATATEDVTEKSVGLWGALNQQMEAVKGVAASWFELADAVGGRIGARSGMEAMADSLNELTDGFKATVPELEAMREEQQKLADEAQEAAAATGDVLVAALGDATAETDMMALALFQAADAAGADADTLYGLADTLGLYTESELQAALATVAMRTALDDLGTAIATGTMTMEGAMDALQGLIATLPQAADLMRQNIGTTHQYASSRQSMARSNREAAQRERELQRAMARTGDFFVDALPEITENTESWALELFQAADAAGASAEELAALGGALGIYSEEQVEAALKTAALMEKIEQLGARIAGGMDVERAIGELSAFRQDLFPVTPAQMGFSGMVGPGYGGPRMFLAGEGRRPEHVNISPTVGSYNTTNIYDQRAAAVLAEQQRRNQRDALARAM